MNIAEKKDLTNYGSIPLETPFHLHPRCKDSTTFMVKGYHSGNRGILIYFHDLKQWINPPTDTSMESNIIRKINKYGVVYLEEGEEL